MHTVIAICEIISSISFFTSSSLPVVSTSGKELRFADPHDGHTQFRDLYDDIILHHIMS